VLTGSSEFIKDLVDDIVYKDIAAVHNVRNLALLKDFFLLLMERAGKRLSINKMASILSISSETAHRYFNYFSDSFLIHTVSRHGKTNEKIRAPKKIYSPDIGIRNYFTGFKDIGSIFENYVFLRIKDKEPSYIYNSGSEIDFITKSGFVLECKFHAEPLEGKQKSLFESFPAEKRMVVRDEISLNSFLDVFEE
jgi:hypothetical protein